MPTSAPTIINNLPKGNVKAPQGAIMKINTGEQLTEKNFNNNTEFVLEFTPDNLDPNGNSIYVKNGITEDEVIIGNNNKTILYNLELDGDVDNCIQYTEEIRFYPILNSDIVYFLEVICQNPNNDSITLIKNNTSQLVQFYKFGDTFGVTNETDFGGEIPPGILFYVIDPISLIDGKILKAGVCYFRYYDSTEEFPSVNVSCQIETISEDINALKFANNKIFIVNSKNEYPLNEYVYLGRSGDYPEFKLYSYNGMLIIQNHHLLAKSLPASLNFDLLDNAGVSFASSNKSRRFYGINLYGYIVCSSDLEINFYGDESISENSAYTWLFIPKID